MATIDNLFESGRGRLGNLVVYKMNGQNIVRTKPAHYSDRKSPAQLAQRQRMQVVNEFTKPFLQLLRVTFPPQRKGRTARSEAQSYIMRDALAGEYPNIYVDKSRALLSSGPLPLPSGAWAELHPEGLLIHWENGEEAAGNAARDTLVVMGLSDQDGQSAYTFTGVRRSEGEYVWKTTLPVRQGALPHVWIAFRNSPQTQFSDSMYVAPGN